MFEWQQWAGETVAILASGPSMTKDDAEYCKGKCRVITVNSTWRLAPWADTHFSNDLDWWDANLYEMRERCSGMFWTGFPTSENIWLHRIPFDKGAPGIVEEPGRIAWAMNSGGSAINLAVQFGAKRIVLLGYDQKWQGAKGHWHEPHKPPLQTGRPGFQRWRAWFEQAARDLDALGVTVINASRETSLSCFNRENLRDVL